MKEKIQSDARKKRKDGILRKRAESLIPTEDQLNRILPALIQVKYEPQCPCCRGFRHRGRCRQR